MTGAVDTMIGVLVNFALGQNNEYSWYGSLNILLSQELNRVDRNNLKVVVPQMALASILNPDLSDDEQDLPISSSGSPDPFDALLISSTSTPSPSQRTVPILPQRNIAPSLSQRGASSQLQGSPDPILLSYSPGSVRSVPVGITLKKLRQLTSHRIPDFVRLRFYDYDTADVTHRVDLIIEIKRRPQDPQERGILAYQALVQVEEQAYHAFEPDSRLLNLGCLVALGNEWMYREINRVEGLNPPSRRDRDSTYQPSEASNQSRSSVNSRSSASAEPQTPTRRIRRPPIPQPPPAPNPDDMTVLVQNQYFSFRGALVLERQRKMLKLIRDRSEQMDRTMVGSYTT